jgi:hypothetical protein
LRIGFHFPWRNTVTRQLAHIFCTVANRRGQLVLIAALIHGAALPSMHLQSEPWPKSLDTGGERGTEARAQQYAAEQKLYP